MLRSDYIERRIPLNRTVTVILKSKKVKGAELYKNTMTIQHEEFHKDPLNFITAKELREEIDKLDLDADQMSLLDDEMDDSEDLR